jgi:hypothetical protein
MISLDYLEKARSASNDTAIPLVNNGSFLDLLTYQSPIDDSIVQNILHLLHQINPSFKYFDTNFSCSLSQRAWNYAFKKFFMHENSSQYAKSTKIKPTLYNETISIPFFVKDSHWVAHAKGHSWESNFLLFG